MEEEVLSFIKQWNLSPFSRTKTPVKVAAKSVFQTRDARAVQTKVLADISREFYFADSANLLQFFVGKSDSSQIKQKQVFFSGLAKEVDSSFLRDLQLERSSWKPPYGIVVVTEDDKTFTQLQKLGCPVKILLNEQDVRELAEMDVVQVIDCEQFGRALEQLPQSVFLKRVEDAYLERYVSKLSEWKSIIDILNGKNLGERMSSLVSEISSLLPLLDKRSSEKITREQVEDALEDIKRELSERVSQMSVSGDSLMAVISQGAIPDELKKVVKESISKTGLPQDLFLQQIPVVIDEHTLEKKLREQDLTEFSSLAEKIASHGAQLSSLPQNLSELSSHLLYFDFCSGVSRWIAKRESFPEVSDRLNLVEARNLFLDNAQPIKFRLDSQEACSILTGANSGGKTTLLEHLLQSLVCLQMGLPVNGKFESPAFSSVYYFAKNKGSMSKGAFETLLTQMSEINVDENTLILADEIEAVTEPGVAGKMIAATASYFLSKGCYLVIATHLGHEIARQLPLRARIDGIEAKGLSETNELIVDHNPVLGKLAHSTPELIIERMVKTQGGDYFEHLYKEVSGLGITDRD